MYLVSFIPILDNMPVKKYLSSTRFVAFFYKNSNYAVKVHKSYNLIWLVSLVSASPVAIIVHQLPL